MRDRAMGELQSYLAEPLGKGQDFVSPDDVQAVAADVLRHRLLLSFEAEANGVTPDQVIQELLALVPVG